MSRTLTTTPISLKCGATTLSNEIHEGLIYFCAQLRSGKVNQKISQSLKAGEGEEGKNGTEVAGRGNMNKTPGGRKARRVPTHALLEEGSRGENAMHLKPGARSDPDLPGSCGGACSDTHTALAPAPEVVAHVPAFLLYLHSHAAAEVALRCR